MSECVVHPLKLRKGLTTVGAVENRDKNTNSTTSKDSFHGTGISFIQHPSHEFFAGEDRGQAIINLA